ncbi:hypothetical protein GQ44DRAFT_628283 [Phaeosphaeriaceae sp. PMI808]|nr:hypothetical protein GQ44DRAFT_628283 [Phaeosphaeriaceae sp. PMI808]
MSAPPTPRSGVSSRGRLSRHDARSHGSRTPSPSKKPSPQTYRTRNMNQANVFVEGLSDLPPVIDNEVRQILGIESWEDRVVDPMDEPHFNHAVAWCLAESRKHVGRCSLEGDWKTILYSLINMLSDPWAAELRVHMPEKVWNSALKPASSSLDDEEEEYSRTCTPRSTQTALPTFNPDDAAATAAAFLGAVPSLPPSSSTPSVAPTTSTEAADPYYISTPKPDITVGLAHTGFGPRQQRRLINHQAYGSILSDPHAAEIGIRFPFLVVEAKGLSLNGSLVSAQNEAAISGAAMLTILRDLDNHSVTDSESTPREIPALCFSIVTMGPIYNMAVHFMYNGAFHMHCFRSCRTTLQRDTLELVSFLIKILRWGRGWYKANIMKRLDQVPQHVALS